MSELIEVSESENKMLRYADKQAREDEELGEWMELRRAIKERDEARTLAALFAVGAIGDTETIGVAMKRAGAITEAIRLAREALESVEAYANLTTALRVCAWCNATSIIGNEMVHLPTCKRDLALTALRGVTQ